ASTVRSVSPDMGRLASEAVDRLEGLSTMFRLYGSVGVTGHGCFPLPTDAADIFDAHLSIGPHRLIAVGVTGHGTPRESAFRSSLALIAFDREPPRTVRQVVEQPTAGCRANTAGHRSASTSIPVGSSSRTGRAARTSRTSIAAAA